MDSQQAIPEPPEPVMPGDRPPRLGRVPFVDNTAAMLRDPLGFYDRAGAHEADVVGYNVAGTTGCFVCHPDLVEQVLVTDADAYEKGQLLQDTLGQFIGEGLFLLEGEEWQRQRTALQPAFYRERIAAYGDTMTEFADRTAAGWSDGQRIDVLPHMQSLTLNILGKTLLDVDIETTADALEPLLDALRKRLDPRSLSAYLPLWVPTGTNRAVNRSLAEFQSTLDDVIAARQREDERAREARDDVLSLLLSLDDETMDRERLGHQLLTFLVAGHDTTALTLTYAWFLLANNPECQQRLHEELDATLGNSQPTPEDLFELPYLDAVLNEALRLYPPAFTVFRQPTEPVTLGGYELSPDAQLTLPQCSSTGTNGGTMHLTRSVPSGGTTTSRRRSRTTLLPLRRRPAPLHRHALRPDGSQTRAGDHCPAVRCRGGHRTPAVAGDADYAEPTEPVEVRLRDR